MYYDPFDRARGTDSGADVCHASSLYTLLALRWSSRRRALPVAWALPWDQHPGKESQCNSARAVLKHRPYIYVSIPDVPPSS